MDATIKMKFFLIVLTHIHGKSTAGLFYHCLKRKVCLGNEFHCTHNHQTVNHLGWYLLSCCLSCCWSSPTVYPILYSSKTKSVQSAAYNLRINFCETLRPYTNVSLYKKENHHSLICLLSVTAAVHCSER